METTITTFKDKSPTLKEMQKLVGGYIEVIYLDSGDQMIVDEEGLLKQKEINRDASIIKGNVIVGNVIILKGKAKLN